MSSLLTQFHNLKQSSYKTVWHFQMTLMDKIKKAKRSRTISQRNDSDSVLNHLIFCEHLPVITIGKSGKEKNLLFTEEQMMDKGIEVHKINRGGDITYHGPGQLTGYLILDLELLYRDVHKYVRTIEEAIIRLLQEYDIVGERLEGFTGVWVRREAQL